jgi:DNA ligase (NAD+)
MANELPAQFEVRGEGFLPLASFEAINKERGYWRSSIGKSKKCGLGYFQNAGFFCGGQKKTRFLCISILSEETVFDTHEESLHWLHSVGFNVSDTWEKHDTIQGVLGFIEKWEEKRHELPLNTDGIVIKINSFAQREELGFTAKSPRWAIAYKYKGRICHYNAKSVSYQVGRTGNITPVANLKPVSLAGTVVKRASVHNANEIERLDLHIGDTVFVEKGGRLFRKLLV